MFYRKRFSFLSDKRKRTRRVVFAVLAVTLLPACPPDDGDASSPSQERPSGGDDGDSHRSDGGGEGTVAEAFVAAGTVVDTQGKPLPNVEIVVDNQLLYDANELGKTDDRGRYRIELPSIAATWHVSATHSVEYHGRTYSFPLHPDDDSAFAGNTGGVRNFEWKLSGKRPDDGVYGAFVVGYTEPGDFSFELKDVELTLVPQGPLVDGSVGETVTGKFVSTPNGESVEDIPLGRYTVSAKVSGTPLGIRIRNSAANYETSLTSDFEAPYGSLSIYSLEVELKLP